MGSDWAIKNEWTIDTTWMNLKHYPERQKLDTNNIYCMITLYERFEQAKLVFIEKQIQQWSVAWGLGLPRKEQVKSFLFYGWKCLLSWKGYEFYGCIHLSKFITMNFTLDLSTSTYVNFTLFLNFFFFLNKKGLLVSPWPATSLTLDFKLESYE